LRCVPLNSFLPVLSDTSSQQSAVKFITNPSEPVSAGAAAGCEVGFEVGAGAGAGAGVPALVPLVVLPLSGTLVPCGADTAPAADAAAGGFAAAVPASAV